MQRPQRPLVGGFASLGNYWFGAGLQSAALAWLFHRGPAIAQKKAAGSSRPKNTERMARRGRRIANMKGF
eukprot:3427217-Pyramimonas_sp.AAC.1